MWHWRNERWRWGLGKHGRKLTARERRAILRKSGRHHLRAEERRAYGRVRSL